MTALEKLQEQLARFDDDAFAALANRGLLRRATKDLESCEASIADSGVDAVVIAIGGQRVQFDARGPAQAQCSCPASGVCQHILAAALWVKRMPPTAPAKAAAGSPVDATQPPSEAVDSLAELHAALMRMGAAELRKHAGKAGYSWAWQFVHDLDVAIGLKISGDRHLVLTFSRPRVTFRYMGGGPGDMIADAALNQIEKYRVAAILAYQRASGAEIAAPEAVEKPRTQVLDLGKDHVIAEGGKVGLRESRGRLRASTRQLLGECVALGLSHLSQDIQERYATLAVWAQGAEYHRLALLLRRLADHVELLLERAGSADEQRLFDEITLAFGLIAALEDADRRELAPVHLLGRARNRYEIVPHLELISLGASPWRSASGYVGLTMLFWSPQDRCFLSCTDARPETQRGFNPVARYTMIGPWSGLGAPSQATGRRLRLTNAQTSALGRLSGSENTNATVQTMPTPDELTALLEPCASWSELQQARALARRSLLAEPQPMRDWVALKPTSFGAAQFDQARQTLVWPLMDNAGERLDAELAFSEYTAHAVERIEAERPVPGTLVIARIRNRPDGLVAEPLSLVRADAPPGRCAVDALYFDAAPVSGFAAKAMDRLRQFAARKAQQAPGIAPSMSPAILREMRQWLVKQAERGISDMTAAQVLRELDELSGRLRSSGFNCFGVGSAGDVPAELLLRAQYVHLQYGQLLGDAEEYVD